VPLARASGAKVIIINGQRTEMDHHGDVVINGQISDVVPALVRAATLGSVNPD